MYDFQIQTSDLEPQTSEIEILIEIIEKLIQNTDFSHLYCKEQRDNYCFSS